jgi:hypothetical protein
MCSIYYDQALKNFKLHTFTKPELVRTMYHKAVFLQNIGNHSTAAQLMDEAKILYNELVPVQGSSETVDLSYELLDMIVPIWSR